jgi:hypothetical protein
MSPRIPAEEKTILLRAAALKHTDLTDFVPPTQLESRKRSDPGSRTLETFRTRQPDGFGVAGESAQAECEAAGNSEITAKAEVSIRTWHEEPIGKGHNRDAFDCGEAALNFCDAMPAEATRWAVPRSFLRSAMPITKRFSATIA